jgi:TPP-dependent pyruvate/acetoin dehydrogenase alpha subunit
MHEFWRKRDCIDRFQKYLFDKKWLTSAEEEKLIAEVEKEIDADREFAMKSPMPEGHTAAEGVYCGEGCHKIQPKYGTPKSARREGGRLKETEAATHFK